MIDKIPAKSILQKVRYGSDKWFGIDYNMNIYHGCPHGCIYCDSRSLKYRIENYDRVRYKADFEEILARELKAKRTRGVVGTGAMSDPYNPFEKELGITRRAMELIAQRRFGASIDTKGSLIVRDIPILQEISRHGSVIVKVTITTASDSLSSKIEPFADPGSARFKAVKELNDAGIFCGILLTPTLPFITDSDSEIREIVDRAHEAGAKFIYCMYGMTMRAGQREYFYDRLEKIYPGLPARYQELYGLNYICESPRKHECRRLLEERCSRLGILTDMEAIIMAYKRPDEFIQTTLF